MTFASVSTYSRIEEVDTFRAIWLEFAITGVLTVFSAWAMFRAGFGVFEPSTLIVRAEAKGTKSTARK